MIVDDTVAPSDIKYPTDLDLLNEAREKSELLIDLLYKPAPEKVKPRTYRKKARKEYLSATKQHKKQKKTIRKAIKKQLNYLKRNLQTIEKLLDEKGAKSSLCPTNIKGCILSFKRYTYSKSRCMTRRAIRLMAVL